jgi:hypothetical protein
LFTAAEQVSADGAIESRLLREENIHYWRLSAAGASTMTADQFVVDSEPGLDVVSAEFEISSEVDLITGGQPGVSRILQNQRSAIKNKEQLRFIFNKKYMNLSYLTTTTEVPTICSHNALLHHGRVLNLMFS